jgi:hypothetical protein
MSPVILDLDSDGFHLGGLADAVEFDLDANGTKDRVTWTRADQLDAFLCLDWNQNGLVDDGAELFGNHTPLASGETRENGYEALLELDDPALGGDGNGIIDPGDQAFGDLCAWIDADHDGVSGPGELWSLEEVGVVGLDPQYVTQRRFDRHGNLFRYRSTAWREVPGAGSRVIQTYDVFLVEE